MDEDDDPIAAVHAYAARVLAAYADFRLGKATRADIKRAMEVSILSPPPEMMSTHSTIAVRDTFLTPSAPYQTDSSKIDDMIPAFGGRSRRDYMRTPEYRQAQSARMKAIWNRKRAQAGSPLERPTTDAASMALANVPASAPQVAVASVIASESALIRALPEDGMRDLIARADAEGCSAEDMAVRLVMAGLGYEFVPAHFAKKGSP